MQNAKSKNKKILRQATLCFLIKDNNILLGMKKRGFGKGKWNGVGGKVKPGETTRQAAMRETQEEIGVIPQALKQMATLNFYFPEIPEFEGWNQQVCVYITDKWQGEPEETEEIRPQWFKQSDIPYDQMWPDDIHWLPRVLKGQSINGQFYFNEKQMIKTFEIKEIRK